MYVKVDVQLHDPAALSARTTPGAGIRTPDHLAYDGTICPGIDSATEK
jgi:hypothetical protein